MRQALVLAFAAGALTGVAGSLTLRRRWQGAGLSADAAGAQLDQSIFPPLGGPFDGPSPDSVSMPVQQA